MSTAGFHITEDCAEVYLQNESGTELLQLAKRLHDYLQQGQHLPVRSLFEATDGCKEISREAFDALAKHRMENTGEVSGVFELGFDARTISALNIMDGWKVYAMQDVANAAEQAFQPSMMLSAESVCASKSSSNSPLTSPVFSMRCFASASNVSRLISLQPSVASKKLRAGKRCPCWR